MAWKIADLALASTSVVSRVQDGSVDVAVTLGVSATERRQLQGVFQYAGRVQEYPLTLGPTLVVDTSPNGENTFFLTVDTTFSAGGMVDEGWFAVAEVSDDWRESTTMNRMEVSLKRIAHRDEAVGEVSATTLFEAHDF